MATTTTRFTDVVRSKLIQNKVDGTKPDSIRSLARQMGKGNEARAATYRRSLFKWMAEGEPNPSPESRALVADALGLDRSDLDADDEESDLSFDLFQRAIAAGVREHLARIGLIALPTERTA